MSIFDGIETECVICKEKVIIGKDETVFMAHHKCAHRECWEILSDIEKARYKDK